MPDAEEVAAALQTVLGALAGSSVRVEVSPATEHLYTVAELSDLVGVHQKTVMRWIRHGELRASDLGRGRQTIRQGDLDAFLDARANRPARVGPGKPIEPAAVATAAALRPAPARRRTGQRGVLTVPERKSRSA